jgi:methylamine dehydrogenase heavy chain
MVRDAVGAAYVFDAASGDMHGLLSISRFTPALQPHPNKPELYAAESYYTRTVRGERTDVVTVYDLPTLSAKAEIEVPNKLAALPFRQYIALLDDERHLLVFNLTPAHSVSVVDIIDRRFVTEISTPGCALVMPTAGRGFLQICGDGRLQLIRLDASGQESKRARSQPFFRIEDDPVADRPVPAGDGWLLTSYAGQVFQASVDGEEVRVSGPWSMLTAADETGNWRPGGSQFLGYHAGLNLLFALMNDEGGYSHDSPGSEIWVFDAVAQRRIGRIALEQPAAYLHVSQNDAPLVTITGEDRQLHVYDALSLRHVRTIPEAGTAPGLLQGVLR